MYPVSSAFLTKIRADERRVLGKVQIDFTDPIMDRPTSILASEQANVSYPDQTANNIIEPYAKFAALDGAWVLGEDFALAPAPYEAEFKEMGWWGSQLADANGYFTAPYPMLTVNLTSRPIFGFNVVGDSKRGEYPVDFEIRLYSGNTLKFTQTVTDNTLIDWHINITPVTEVTKLVLEIQRWSHAGRQVKIVEFFTSLREIYEDNAVIFLRVVEEREVSQGSLPVGNISANQVEVRLDNSSREFDVGSGSALSEFLRPNRRIKPYLGIEHDNGVKEWVPLGVFWSKEWSVPRDKVYVQTVGQDRLEFLQRSTYSTSQVQVNKTLYDLAVAIFQDVKLRPDEYQIDSELKQFTIPYAYFESISHREALRLIAEASLGQVYCDRHGVIRLESFSSRPGQGEEITADNYFKKDRPIKWGEIANFIEIETQPLKPDVLQEVYKSSEPVNIGAGQRKVITARYNETPCIDATATLESAPPGCIIEQAVYYAWGAEITVYSPTTAGTFVLVINARPLKVLNKEKIIAKDDVSIINNGIIRYVYPENPLVQTPLMAQNIADRLLQSFKDPRRDVELEWRGNPALELGDAVIIREMQDWEQFFTVRQELEYDGALKAQLSGRKM